MCENTTLNIPLLQRLFPVGDENWDAFWIKFDAFVEFLKRPHRSTDEIKSVRRNNIQVEVKSHRNGLKEISGILHVSLTSAIRYLFHSHDQLAICREAVFQILEKRLLNKSHNPTTVFEIHRTVVSYVFGSNVITNFLLQNTKTCEDNIQSLCMDYKDSFSSDQWAKICYFEHHFCRQLKLSPLNYTYEELLRLRNEFLQDITYTNKLSATISTSSNSIIVDRTKRKNVTNEEEDTSIHCGLVHSPKVIETQIVSEFPDISIALCLDCLQSCKHTKAVIEHEHNSTESINDLNVGFSQFLMNHHELFCCEIIYFYPEAFTSYKDKLGRPRRYKFREDVVGHKKNNDVARHWINRNENPNKEDSDEKCVSCYKSQFTKPLSWKNYDILQEWTFDVPLHLQIILDSCINENTINRTVDLDNLVKTKLAKMYTTYDVLLNQSNRTYCGLQQDLNSKELALNHQSVSTVFAVTSGAGATLSLNESESRLKEMANEDFCHFNTYMKKHPMQYETDAGMVSCKISLQDCYLILLMDNLVRLKYRADPGPSENRTNQLCTLPITLKGVPKDSKEVNSWHMENCNTQLSCACKRDIELTKEEFAKQLLTLSSDEQKMSQRFTYLMNWGYSVL